MLRRKKKSPLLSQFYTDLGSSFQPPRRNFLHFMWIVGKFQTSSMGASLKFTFLRNRGGLMTAKLSPPPSFYLKHITKTTYCFSLNFSSSQQTVGGLCLFTVKYRINIILLLLLHALGSHPRCVHTLPLSTFNCVCAPVFKLKRWPNPAEDVY